MWREPAPFDVVWCRFPYQGGARHHPCLVLLVGEAALEPGRIWLLVAGGTSASKVNGGAKSDRTILCCKVMPQPARDWSIRRPFNLI